MTTYSVKVRKKFLWKNLTKLVGHKLDKDLNRMDFYFEDGSILSLSHWDQYDMKLGLDWKAFTLDQMSKEAGVKVG